MPRRNGSRGEYHQPGRKAGSVARKSRRSRRGKSAKKKG